MDRQAHKDPATIHMLSSVARLCTRREVRKTTREIKDWGNYMIHGKVNWINTISHGSWKSFHSATQICVLCDSDLAGLGRTFLHFDFTGVIVLKSLFAETKKLECTNAALHATCSARGFSRRPWKRVIGAFFFKGKHTRLAAFESDYRSRESIKNRKVYEISAENTFPNRRYLCY